MHKRIAGQRRVFRVALAVVAIFVFYFYGVYILQADLKSFIFHTSGPVFVALATLSGLGFSFAGVIKTESDRSTVSLAAEKLLHATVLFAFAILIGVIAIQLEESKYLPKVAQIVRILIGLLGLYLYFVSAQSAMYGIEWLSDILYTRWSRRAIVADDPDKTIKDSLEYEIEGLPESKHKELPKVKEADMGLPDNQKLPQVEDENLTQNDPAV